MDSTERLSTKQRLFAISCIVLGVVFLSGAALSLSRGGSQKKDDRQPTVKDKTGSLSLISLESTDGMFVMRMQNTSGKAITAYGMAVCDVPESSTDYTIGDYSIQPGEIVQITMPTQAVTDKCGSHITQPTISILAVIFDDRTFAGEFQWAKGILDVRRGKKQQLKRINSLLAKALKWPDAGEPAAIERLKNEISSLAVDQEEPPSVRTGIFAANQDAVFLLDELKQWHQKSLTTQSLGTIPVRGELAGIKNLKEGIGKLINLNEKWISRY